MAAASLSPTEASLTTSEPAAEITTHSQPMTATQPSCFDVVKKFQHKTNILKSKINNLVKLKKSQHFPKKTTRATSLFLAKIDKKTPANRAIIQEYTKVINNIHIDLMIKTSQNILKRHQDNKTKNKTTHKHNNKTRLPLFCSTNSFVNLTHETIPTEVQSYIELGPNFIPPTTHLNIPKIDLAESIISINDLQIEQQCHNFLNIRDKLINQVYKNRNRKPTTVETYITRIKNKHDEYIKRNPNITVIQADKGNISTIMNYVTYYDKMRHVINVGIDDGTYVKINNDHEHVHKSITQVKKYRIKNWLLYAANHKNMNKTVQEFQIHDLNMPRLYGRIKIHKEGHPLRPIVDTINTHSYFISKYVQEILHKLKIDKNYNITNSIDVVHKINALTYNDDNGFAKIDIVNMFTNIPVDETISIIKLLYTQKYGGNHDQIPFDTIYPLLVFTFKDAMYIQFDNDIYKQKRGFPMGNSVSQIAAELYVDYKLLHEAKDIFVKYNIDLLVKYVDDFLIYAPIINIPDIVISIEIATHLKFTIDLEIDNKIDFLEITIIRDHVDKIFHTCWYKKPYSSDRMINHLSNHKPSIKTATINEHISKIICTTDTQFIIDIIDKTYARLKLNKYPTYYINDRFVDILNREKFNSNEKLRTISEHITSKYKAYCNKTKPSRKHKNTDVSDISNIYVSIPYIKHITNDIKNTCIRNHLRIKWIHKNPNGKMHKNMKDPIPDVLKTNKIIILKCNNCNNHFIATTGTSNVANTIRKIKSNTQSLINIHLSMFDHNTDFLFQIIGNTAHNKRNHNIVARIHQQILQNKHPKNTYIVESPTYPIIHQNYKKLFVQ